MSEDLLVSNSSEKQPSISYKQLLNIILDEIIENVRKIHPPAINQADRRSFVRNVFSCIEGSTYAFKAWALDINPDSLTHQEVDVIKEKVSFLNHNGEAETQTLKIQTLPNIDFSFKILSKVMNIENPLDKSNHGWEQLRKAIKIRHRLTHPKSAEDLTISNEEMILLSHAVLFYTRATAELTRRIGRRAGIDSD